MVLSSQEESLIGVVRALPPDEAGKVLSWARQLADLSLADLSGGRSVQWSDSWSAEDLDDVTSAACAQFERGEQNDQ